MAIRILSGLVALPILIILISIGGFTLKIALLIISLIGIHEFYKAFSKENKIIFFVGYLSTIIYVFFIDDFNILYFKIFLTSFILLSSMVLVFNHQKINIIDMLITVCGFFYVPYLLSNVYLTKQMNYGSYFVWLIFISAFGCDTGAYFIGVSLGKHKLIETLSPKKTIEGSIGGLLTASLLGYIYSIFITKGIPSELKTKVSIACVIACFISSIFSQFGDLTASAIKRFTGIKDFGKIMPGHGGVLDRFDSVLFTAPVIFFMMNFWNF